MKVKTDHYKDLLNRFDTHIISTKSIKTGNHYTSQIDSFLVFLEQLGVYNLKKVNTPIMKDYFRLLHTRPKKRGTGTLSVRAVNDNLSTLRMFSKRMQKEDVIIKGLPIPSNIQIERNSENPFTLVREVLTTDEVKIVFNACNTQLEKALIALAYGSGLRRGTLNELKDSQIDYSKGLVTVLKAKNNKTREVPISNFFLSVLKEYGTQRIHTLARIGSREQRFFIDENGKHVRGVQLNQILKKVIKRTKNETIEQKNITLHCLRHSIATHLMDAGSSFEYVRNFLGHSQVGTSSIYAKRRKIKNIYVI